MLLHSPPLRSHTPYDPLVVGEAVENADTPTECRALEVGRLAHEMMMMMMMTMMMMMMNA